MSKQEFQLTAKAIEEHYGLQIDMLTGLLQRNDGELDRLDPELGKKIRGVTGAMRSMVDHVKSRRG